MRPRITALVSAVLLLAAFLGTDLATSTVVPRQYPDSKACEQRQTPDKRCTTLRSRIFEGAPIVYVVGAWLEDHNGALTGVSTALLTIITAVLGWGAIEQFKTTRAQLRAYVLVEKASISKFAIKDHPEAKITIKNFGQTPAYFCSHASIIGFQRFPLKEPVPIIKKDDDPTTILGPGATMDILPTLSTEVMTSMKLRAAARGTHAIYIVGEVHYRDCFDRAQSTKYCLFSGGGEIELGNVSTYDTGNEAT